MSLSEFELESLIAGGEALRRKDDYLGWPEPDTKPGVERRRAPELKVPVRDDWAQRGRPAASLSDTWIDPEETDFVPVQRPGSPLAARAFSWLVTALFISLLAWLIVPELQSRIVHRDTIVVRSGVLSAHPVPLAPTRPSVVVALYVDAGDLPDGVLPAGSPIALIEADNPDGRGMVRQQIRVPFDARFASVDTLVGAVTQPGTPVATVYDPTKMYIIATVRHDLLDLLWRGMAVQLTSELLGHPIKGTVISAVPKLGTDLDPNSSDMVNIRIRPDTAEVADLVPGIRFDAMIDVSSAPPGAQPLVITNLDHDED